MICRVCNESISFVKGSRPGKRKKASWAVHESELSQTMEQSRVEMVNPHPGNQRKLRQETAAQDSAATQSASAGQGAGAARQQSAGASQGGNLSPGYGTSEGRPDSAPQGNTTPVPEEEVPGAQAVNRPTDSSSGNEGQQSRNFGL
jgi:phage protein D